MKGFSLHTAFLLLLLLAFHGISSGQSGLRSKVLLVKTDTLTLDTLSIIPGSLELKTKNGLVDSTTYQVDFMSSTLIFKKIPNDTLYFSYRVYPVNFTKSYFNKDPSWLTPEIKTNIDPFTYSIKSSQPDVFETEGLQKSGSISRGITFGNNQNLSVNSSLNLAMNGRLAGKLNVQASITDDNIPIQPEGNTQQLQDFDQVFIKIYDERSQLTAGDFWMKKPMGYFMVYNKRAQGASFSTGTAPGMHGKDSVVWSTRASAAVSKGKFARNIIQGVEGNQGPYRLRGAENETFIIVLAGTEQVFIDGQLMKRGQEYDYIIDYNTAEVTFTANQLITKDKRIIVEFQYSDKNYARSILESSLMMSNKKFTYYFNAYSEQDSKNQPLQQDLSPGDKEILASVGDSLHQAINWSIDSVGYSDNLVLYKMTDSLGYDSVFVYSVNPDSAFFKLGFSYVGEGKGNYVQSEFTALGRTFRWVAPDTVAGQLILRGNYAPVILLVTPKKRQMLTSGWEYRYKNKSKIWFEGAYSRRDLNTFSDINNEDDDGYGLRAGWDHVIKLPSEKKDLTLSTSISGETVSSTFNYIERFRPVEFERNWNIQNYTLNEDQYIANADLVLEKKSLGKFNYGLNSFFSGTEYSGVIHRMYTGINTPEWSGQINGSMLKSTGLNQTTFIRHKANLARKFRRLTIGFRDDQEYNRFFYPGSDSLLGNSYRYYDWEVYLENPDTAKNKFTVFYRERTDWLRNPENTLGRTTKGTSYGFYYELLSIPSHRIKLKLAYRDLIILDTTLTVQDPDRTLLSRIEYDGRLLKKAITWSTFYEIGTGQELKREFIYIEVPAGQGVYAWNDYNENGIKELNEFEIASFPDQALYIRTFTPTDEYVRTYTNQFSQSVNINPSAVWHKEKKGWKKNISYLSNQTSYRIERKTNSEDELKRFNPFLQNIADSSLQSLNLSFRNTLFFNRTGSVFGADYTYQDVKGKYLLTNGFDSRSNTYHLVKTRLNISRVYGIIIEGEKGIKANASDFLSGRNYSIRYSHLINRFTIQPNNSMRISLSYKYSVKNNEEESGGETALLHDIGTELRYNVIDKGSLLANFNYILISYDGLVNSSLAFEMLEALLPGQNFTWSASIQRNLSNNMQLNLIYNGRKTEETRSIHSGGVQVRAFF